jgi:hypothetical protein
MRRGVLIQIFFLVLSFLQNAPPHSPTIHQNNRVIPNPHGWRKRNLPLILVHHSWLTEGKSMIICTVTLVYKDQGQQSGVQYFSKIMSAPRVLNSLSE